jgi:polyphosphate kinase
MERNLDRRVEVAFPVLDGGLQVELQAILDTQLADTVKARVLGADGRATRRESEGSPLRSQALLHQLTASPSSR